MGLLDSLRSKKTAQGVNRQQLPPINSFVEAAAVGGASGSVCVESIGKTSFTTSAGIAASVGTTVGFAYTTSTGKYRFSAKVTAATPTSLTFDLPTRIDQLGSFGGQKRSNVRLDTTVAGEWRLCKEGKGEGKFQRASIHDISRGGASLITEVHLKAGTYVEIRIALTAQPLTLIGEVVRSQKLGATGKNSHGLRFHSVLPDQDRAILDYINRRQVELRGRGLA